MALCNECREVILVKRELQPGSMLGSSLEVHIFIHRNENTEVDELMMQTRRNEVIEKMCEVATGISFEDLEHSEIVVKEQEFL